MEDDLRLFIREQTTRMERATFHMERALVRMGDRMERSLDLLERRIEDQSGQIRANTQAVLAVLDRLEGGKA